MSTAYENYDWKKLKWFDPGPINIVGNGWIYPYMVPESVFQHLIGVSIQHAPFANFNVDTLSLMRGAAYAEAHVLDDTFNKPATWTGHYGHIGIIMLPGNQLAILISAFANPGVLYLFGIYEEYPMIAAEPILPGDESVDAPGMDEEEKPLEKKLRKFLWWIY